MYYVLLVKCSPGFSGYFAFIDPLEFMNEFKTSDRENTRMAFPLPTYRSR